MPDTPVPAAPAATSATPASAPTTPVVGPATPVVGLVVSGAGGAEGLLDGFVRPAVTQGWQVAITLTPTAARWFEAADLVTPLADLTGLPVRWNPRLPTEPKPHPPADCYAVAPATANTIAKLALGLSDNQALTHLCEALGMPNTPVILLPRVSPDSTRHPAWPGHLERLRDAGVRILPTTSGPTIPWEQVLAAVADELS
ncbi:flavoprotein [Crossiella cryophila]|uniref:Flavoprotein domain-containing protein n=1 Tax=Crossiella cryophila TaxID=43355 RepID=A0A7W7CC77_9PSEU|nr:flavoprotein [Crossiella cryophila]MBB4676879.1 hypothetical protein [Crossiella cryophila]